MWLLCLLSGLATAIPTTVAADSIEHVVIVWLREPGNTTHRERIIAASQVLREIPGVTGLRAGFMLPSVRPIVDSSFDVALIISLHDTAAMADYLSNPIHVKLVEETLKPLVEKIRVYDFNLADE